MRARTWGDGDSTYTQYYVSIMLIVFIRAIDISREQYKGHVEMLNILQTGTRIVHIPRDQRICLFPK
jgi:preprotein translocase subunit YajC